MKKFGISIIALAILGMTAAFITPPVNEALEIGAAAPATATKMQDVSGKMMSLQDLKKENGLLVIFSCNTCPFVVGAPGYGTGWEGRYNDVYEQAKQAGVGMVLVNSNEAKREGADSFEKMQERAKSHNYASPYVVDKNSALADAFGAKTTPHVFLFDGDMKLIYKGAIDDQNADASKVTTPWLKDALQLTGQGQASSIDPNTTRNKGCSIKRMR